VHGEVVAEQEGFDAMGGVEPDGSYLLGALEDVIASLEVGLVAVGGKGLGGGRLAVVG
jgi:hypothetical protein